MQPTRYKGIAIAALLALAVGGSIYFSRRSGSDPAVYTNDFNVYYFAGRQVAAGNDPYHERLGPWVPYLYPPLLAELLVPLTLLPIRVAAGVWFLVSFSSFAAAVWFSLQLSRKSHVKTAVERPDNQTAVPQWLAAAIGIALVSRFTLDNFDLGQVNIVVAALGLAHLCFFQKGRKAVSILALALAFSIKLTPILLIGYHLARRRFKFAAITAACSLALALSSFAVLGQRGPEALKTFWGQTIQNQQGYNLADPGNQSLRGAIARLAGDEAEASRTPDAPISLALSVILLLAAMWIAARPGEGGAASALFFCLFVVLSPLSWKAHFVGLIFPGIYLALRVISRTRLAVAGILAVIFILFNLFSPRVLGLGAAEWADRHSLVLLGAILMYLVIATESLWRDKTLSVTRDSQIGA